MASVSHMSIARLRKLVAMNVPRPKRGRLLLSTATDQMKIMRELTSGKRYRVERRKRANGN